MYQGIESDSRVIREWFESDSWVIREWFESDSWVIHEWFMSDSWVIREWFVSDSWVIREWFEGDSRVIREWFDSHLWMIQEWFERTTPKWFQFGNRTRLHRTLISSCFIFTLLNRCPESQNFEIKSAARGDRLLRRTRHAPDCPCPRATTRSTWRPL